MKISQTLNLLLIEDDPGDRDMVEELLSLKEDRDFKLEHNALLSSGIQRLSKEKFDVVLLDLFLPDSSGLDTFTRLHNESLNIPIIVLTGLEDEELGIHAVSHGAQDYLIKGQVDTILLWRSILYGIERIQAETTLKESEAKYRKLSEELAEANNLKELLFDVMTHDLRNHVSSISGFAELLHQDLPNNPMIHTIKNNADSLLQIIENADTLSQLTLGEKIQKENTNLTEIIKEVCQGFSLDLQNANMTVELKLPNQLTAEANKIIAEVFRNYISNAIKHAREGKKIVIEGSDQRDKVIIQVKDFGSAIPEKYYAHIFGRRVKPDEEIKVSTGLGLAIAKRVAESHEGKVWVEPNHPRGNVFYLSLPKK